MEKRTIVKMRKGVSATLNSLHEGSWDYEHYFAPPQYVRCYRPLTHLWQFRVKLDTI
jgi:hypothetical protein